MLEFKKINDDYYEITHKRQMLGTIINYSNTKESNWKISLAVPISFNELQETFKFMKKLK